MSYADLHRSAMQLLNKTEKLENLSECDENRNIRLKGQICLYQLQIRTLQNKMRDEIFNPFIFGSPAKTSKTCIKTRVLEPGKFPQTHLAVKEAGFKIGALTESEKSVKDIVCPSSKTKLMLVGGNKHASVQLLSPNKNCTNKIKNLPNCGGACRFFNRPAAASYTSTTTLGEDRVLVCGGQTGGWKKSQVIHMFADSNNKCYSISSDGKSWRKEPFFYQAAKSAMVFDKYNFHAFGGFDGEDVKRNKLKVDYYYKSFFNQKDHF
jgi:hypothetical protein